MTHKQTLLAGGALCAFVLLASVHHVSAATPADAAAFKPKTAGTIMVRGRGLIVNPDPGGDVLTSAGVDTGLNVDRVTTTIVPEVDVSYFLTDNIATELIAATTNHHISAGGTDVGDVQLLPPTLTLQYHFMPDRRFSPYVGAGVNYTFFFNEESATSALVDHLEVDNAWGGAVQVGIDYAVSGNWGLNLDAKHLWLRPDVKTRSLKVDHARLDPWLIGFGVSYKF